MRRCQGLDFFGAMLAASRAAAWNYRTICCMAGSLDRVCIGDFTTAIGASTTSDREQPSSPAVMNRHSHCLKKLTFSALPSTRPKADQKNSGLLHWMLAYSRSSACGFPSATSALLAGERRSGAHSWRRKRRWRGLDSDACGVSAWCPCVPAA